VVFTGLLDLKKPGEYLYLTMEGDPVGSGTHTLRRGRPPYGQMGREISFENLPKRCRRLVLDTYRGLWDL
jgi:hypothetical protein